MNGIILIMEILKYLVVLIIGTGVAILIGQTNIYLMAVFILGIIMIIVRFVFSDIKKKKEGFFE